MSTCIAAEAGLDKTKPAWRAVYALALGVFGLSWRSFCPPAC